MNLYIRADADSKIGTGHLMRCIALAQAWQDRRGNVTFISHCESEALRQRIIDEGFDFMPIERPHPDPYDLSQTLLHLKHLSHFPFPISPVWLVLDGYHFDSDYQLNVKKTDNKLLVIDDMAHLPHYYADIILNQNLHANDLHYVCEPYTRLLLGTKYVLLRREFLKWRGWKRQIQKVAKKVLVTLGGADPENATLKVIQALQLVNIDGLEAAVVVGASNPHYDELQRAVQASRLSIRLETNASNMPELMAWADFAVSAAGTTAWELMFMGLPALLTAAADNQEPIARSVADAGAAIWIDHKSAEWTQLLVERVSQFSSDYALRLEMSKKGKKLVSGKGCKRIISAMSQEVLV